MSRAATSRVKVNPQLGLRPSLENRRIHELNVDPSYQRSTDSSQSQKLIRKIAQFWDWGLFQPLVVARRSDGTFWVVDGQHRLSAARLRNDIYDLPCVVTQYERAGDEAATFVALNIQRKQLTRMELFRAAVSAGDDASMEIMSLIEAAGLSIAAHSNWTAWKPGQISNIGGVIKAHRQHGAKATCIALKALAKGFDGQILRYAGTIFGGVVGVVALELAKGDDFSPILLQLTLAGAEQDQWMRDIRAAKLANPNMRWEAAATLAISTAYTEAYGEE